jgi:hypothetical protein
MFLFSGCRLELGYILVPPPPWPEPLKRPPPLSPINVDGLYWGKGRSHLGVDETTSAKDQESPPTFPFQQELTTGGFSFTGGTLDLDKKRENRDCNGEHDLDWKSIYVRGWATPLKIRYPLLEHRTLTHSRNGFVRLTLRHRPSPRQPVSQPPFRLQQCHQILVIEE